MRSPSNLQTAFDSLVDRLLLGGPVLVILLGMSVIALAIILAKSYQLAVMRLREDAGVDRAIAYSRTGQDEQALHVLAGRQGPVARVLSFAITAQMRQNLDQRLIREEVQRIAREQLEIMRSHLRGLEVIGTLSPLLGLLGTVLGMIEAFQRIEKAGDRVNAAILSGGIWEALLTTAAGLAVAVPALIALSWFERIIQRTSHAMEDGVTKVFTRFVYMDTGGETRDADRH